MSSLYRPRLAGEILAGQRPAVQTFSWKIASLRVTLTHEGSIFA